MFDKYIFVRSILTTGTEKERESEGMNGTMHEERSNECRADRFANVSGIRLINGLLFNDKISKPFALVKVARIDSTFASFSSAFSDMMRFCKPLRDDPGKLSELNPLQSVIESRFRLGSEGRVLKDWILVARSSCNRFTLVNPFKNAHVKLPTLQSIIKNSSVVAVDALNALGSIFMTLFPQLVKLKIRA